MSDQSALRPEELVSARLRALYQAWGYASYKVNRFEEYDLYMRNKSFLTDDHILTFTDTDGKLMALKPDITLSVVKNAREEEMPLKICYAESVYRVPHGAFGFREIMQTGVESIGELDLWDSCEVILLACKSLEIIRPDRWQLDISDIGIIASLLGGEVLTGEERSDLLNTISGKNVHGLKELCVKYGVSRETCAMLETLVRCSGPLLEALEEVKELRLPAACEESLRALEEIGQAAEALGLDHLSLDFSVVNDMSYYNGLIFQGFVDGVPASVLSGGRYDPLMARMGKRGSAIGFAVYLDQMTRLFPTNQLVFNSFPPVQREGKSLREIALEMSEKADRLAKAKEADR